MGPTRSADTPVPSWVPDETTEEHLLEEEWVADRSDDALLLLVDGPERGRAIRLERTTTIGRDSEADIVIRDTALSRLHARLTRDEGGYYVEDLGSRNGTYVDSARVVGRVRLTARARLAFGRTLASFAIGGALETELLVGVHEQARRDPLTGLHNRGVFDEHLDAECAYAARSGKPLAVMMIDLDRFKRINDDFGHQAGDIVLRVVAASLQRVMRRYDLVARYGGEELAIIARDVTPRNAEILGERVRSTIQSLRIPWEGKTIPVTASLGIASYDAARFRDPAAFLAAADRALYEAKRSGRNRVVVAT